jgi:hypothetical protein
VAWLVSQFDFAKSGSLVPWPETLLLSWISFTQVA